MAASRTPIWRPISWLPLVATYIGGVAESNETQLANLRRADQQPYVLDDQTIDRLVRALMTQANDAPHTIEQLRRWSEATLTAPQRRAVERLQVKMRQVIASNEELLDLARRLRSVTIDRLLEKSDVELGIKAVLSMRHRTRDQ